MALRDIVFSMVMVVSPVIAMVFFYSVTLTGLRRPVSVP
jgi:hypothetical protein